MSNEHNVIDWTVLPCGCRYAVVDDTFVLETCPLGLACEWVKYAQQITAEQGKPSTILEMP